MGYLSIQTCDNIRVARGTRPEERLKAFIEAIESGDDGCKWEYIIDRGSVIDVAYTRSTLEQLRYSVKKEEQCTEQ